MTGRSCAESRTELSIVKSLRAVVLFDCVHKKMNAEKNGCPTLYSGQTTSSRFGKKNFETNPDDMITVSSIFFKNPPGRVH